MFLVSYSIGYQNFYLQPSGGYAGGFRDTLTMEKAKASAVRFDTMQEACEFAVLYKGHMTLGG